MYLVVPLVVPEDSARYGIASGQVTPPKMRKGVAPVIRPERFVFAAAAPAADIGDAANAVESHVPGRSVSVRSAPAAAAFAVLGADGGATVELSGAVSRITAHDAIDDAANQRAGGQILQNADSGHGGCACALEDRIRLGEQPRRRGFGAVAGCRK